LTINIIQVPAFDDNYLWLLHRQNSQRAYAVDPGDAQAINQALTQHRLELAGILLTHHHWDHTNGVAELRAQHKVPVYGPKSEKIQGVSHALEDQQTLNLEDGIAASILAVPGHTLDHIAYLIDDPQQAPVLFCGDTLFSAGCGRMFEGTPEQMHRSLSTLGSLSKDTQVFCAHEYTLANLAFAAAVEPSNTDIIARTQEVQSLRQQGLSSIPTNIAIERLTNPFLRCKHADVISAATKHGSLKHPNTTKIFAELRLWKDNF